MYLFMVSLLLLLGWAVDCLPFLFMVFGIKKSGLPLFPALFYAFAMMIVLYHKSTLFHAYSGSTLFVVCLIVGFLIHLMNMLFVIPCGISLYKRHVGK